MSQLKESYTGNSHDQCRALDKKAEKYSLRPRANVRRLQQDRFREGFSKKDSKCTKSRPPPLSKYRRKTANARERHRMKEINDAFETLRRILPDFCTSRVATATTKINTLRLAVSYIRALSHILQEGHPGNITLFGDIHIGEDRAQDGSNLEERQYQISPGTSEESFSPSSLCSSSLSPLSCSLGSGSDINEFLSDDSCCVFEDSFDLFNDIPTLSEVDPITLLLTTEEMTQMPG